MKKSKINPSTSLRIDGERSRTIKNQNCNSKLKNSKTLERAVSFHGHLGPYLVLGLLMGKLAIYRLKCKKHFGISALVRGAVNKPKSCLIDGIQIATGCTYGKGNIQKVKGRTIQVLFSNLRDNKKMAVRLKKNLITKLDVLNGHKESKVFARELLKVNPLDIFELKF